MASLSRRGEDGDAGADPVSDVELFASREAAGVDILTLPESGLA